MQQSDEIKHILTEIRDAQREHLDEYKRVTQRSVELQQRAVDKQEQIGKIYRIALAVSGILVIGIVLLIIYLMNFIPPRSR